MQSIIESYTNKTDCNYQDTAVKCANYNPVKVASMIGPTLVTKTNFYIDLLK